MFTTAHAIHTCDARDLSFLPGETIDLVVTSPPYPMIEMWDETFRRLAPKAAEALDAGLGWSAFEEMHRALEPVWSEVQRTLRPGGIIALNIGDATRSVGGSFALYPNHARLISGLTALGLETLPTIIWRKPTNSPTKFMGSGMLPGGAYVTLEHEYILILRKPVIREGRRKEGEETRQVRRRSAIFWEERNQWYQDVWDLRGVRQKLDRPAGRARSGAFPFEVPFRLIHMYSRQGETVLDPFGGTGTTALAAISGARHSVSVEWDGDLAERSAANLLNGVDRARERVARRLLDHEEFRRQFQEARSQDLPYRNDALGTTVRTRQETDLRPQKVVELTHEAGAEGRRLLATYEAWGDGIGAD